MRDAVVRLARDEVPVHLGEDGPGVGVYLVPLVDVDVAEPVLPVTGDALADAALLGFLPLLADALRLELRHEQELAPTEATYRGLIELLGGGDEATACDLHAVDVDEAVADVAPEPGPLPYDDDIGFACFDAGDDLLDAFACEVASGGV